MFMRILKQLDDHFEEYLLAVLLILISCVMMLQVIMRYVFRAALSWPEEFCRYAFVYSTFLTVGLCIRKDSMLKVDLVQGLFSNKIRQFIDLILKSISLVFYTVLFYNSFELVAKIYESKQSSAAIGFPMYMLYFCTIIGFGIATIRSVQSIILTIKRYYFSKKEIGGRTV